MKVIRKNQRTFQQWNAIYELKISLVVINHSLDPAKDQTSGLEYIAIK